MFDQGCVQTHLTGWLSGRLFGSACTIQSDSILVILSEHLKNESNIDMS